MKHRISTGVLIFKDNKILLVKHVDPETSFTWWVPPGGGVKGSESLEEAAKRETLEESGLSIEVGRIVYVRQLIINEKETNQIIIYMLAKSFSGELTINNLDTNDADSEFIKDVKFFSKKEVKELRVFPELIADEMWDDYEKGFPEAKFLGLFEEQVKK